MIIKIHINYNPKTSNFLSNSYLIVGVCVNTPRSRAKSNGSNTFFYHSSPPSSEPNSLLYSLYLINILKKERIIKKKSFFNKFKVLLFVLREIFNHKIVICDKHFLKKEKLNIFNKIYLPSSSSP